MTVQQGRPHVSVVIAVYNDEAIIPELYSRLRNILTSRYPDYEIIFVDDGSRDRSLSILTGICQSDPRNRVFKLMRNFSQPNAIAAGLDQSRGEIVVVMDSDLQDPPEQIPQLIAALSELNLPMAIARSAHRNEPALRTVLSGLFHWMTAKFTDLNLEPGLGVFRAIRRDVLDQLSLLPEKTGTHLSLLHWMGVPYATVDMERDPRLTGRSGYTLKRLVRITCDRFFSYSLFPIRLATTLGIILSISSILLALFYFLQKLFSLVLPGWTTIVVLILFLFGMNFFILGMFGEYMGRIFLESRGRPKYVIDWSRSSGSRTPRANPEDSVNA